MFNVGGGELIVIMLLALIVLGPKRLPDAARQVGKVMADLRRLSAGFQNEVRTALDDDPQREAARRNVLAKEEPAADTTEAAHPVRTEPLVAGPGLEPRRLSAQERAAAKKKAAATNGTPVKPKTKATAAKKAPGKPARRPTT